MYLHSPILKYILEVAKCGSIRHAAKNVHISSSAINRRIIELENQIGIKLFERTAAGVTPSKAGAILIKHISKTLKEAEITFAKIAELKSPVGHDLNLAGAYSIRHIFVELLDDYYTKFPASFLSFSAAANSLDLLESKQVQLAVTFESGLSHNLKIVSKMSLPSEVLMTPDHPLASNKYVSISECCKYPLILPDSTWPTHERLNEIFTQGGYTPQIASSANIPEIMQSVVKKRGWLGIQSRIGLEDELKNKRLRCVPLLLDNEETLDVDLIIAIHEEETMTEHLSFVINWLNTRFENYKSIHEE